MEYDSLLESQRSTFESIVHALESEGLVEIVDRVTAIWGEDSTSTQGMDQFRISVVLVGDAVAELGRRRYKLSRRGHVKFPDGSRLGDRDVDSARQPGRRPALQIAWVEDHPTVGEIDIDYRETSILDAFGLGHMSPENSDVRALVFPSGPSHYDEHVRRYGTGLEDWWR